MHTHMCRWSVGMAILAVGGWIYLSAQGNAAQDAALKSAVLNIAEGLKKGETASADVQAEKLAKKVEDLEDLMNVFKKRNKGGIGVGSKPGVIAAAQDGIETKLVALGRDAPSGATLKKEAAALEEMGYVVSAVARVTKHKPVTGAKAKEWNGWCADMAAAGLKLSAAAKSQSAAEVKTVASKINATCNACHSTYRK